MAAITTPEGRTRIFVDVDGTLTKDPDGSWGEPRGDIINVLQAAIAAGHHVVVWSAQGEEYAKAFCRKYHIIPQACMCKPYLFVDDCPTLRPEGFCKIIAPEELAKELLKLHTEGKPC